MQLDKVLALLSVTPLVVMEMHLLDISRVTPTLKTFKVKFNRALSNLIKLKMTLLAAGGLKQMTFKDSFQPKHSDPLISCPQDGDTGWVLSQQRSC